MDELQSVGVGVALGLIVVSVLTFYPGNPFDYTTDREITDKSDETSTISDDPTNINASTTEKSGRRQQREDIEQAAQRVKIQKLQELLGLEKEKTLLLVERAKAQAISAAKTPGRRTFNSYSTSCKSAWLDRSFFIIMLGLLVWVLWQDYSINFFSIAAYLLPREAQMVRQVAAAPQHLVSQFLELW